jgi:hypothetical protein
MIEQKQDYLFSFDIELQIKDSKGSYILKIPVSDRITRKSIGSEKVIEITPDPNVNLLFMIDQDRSKTPGSPIIPEIE